MKIKISIANGQRGRRAWTLIEMMTSLVLFTLLFAGLITVNMYGLQQDELTNSKLGANDQARENFNLILDEIRSSKNVQIGTGNYTNFTAITNGPQRGDTLQIIPSTNLNVCIYYWFDTNNNYLWRASSSNSVVTTNIVSKYLTNTVSQWITNSMIFSAMDYTGTTNLTVDPTNYNYNYVVAFNLQFYQYQYPLTMVGSNYLYNYYQLTFSATRRSP
jgi:type II secretory pathway pseudopilin PulG